jgi:hypothetical protein
METVKSLVFKEKKIIILRHDFDWVHGLNLNVDRMFSIERKHEVRSTIFLRYDRGVSELKYQNFYKTLENNGWEFGLHLANHVNSKELPSPLQELKKVRSLDLNILGVSACGGNFKWNKSLGYLVQDSLGLNYICSDMVVMKPEDYKFKSILTPFHLTLDGYLKTDGFVGFNRFLRAFTKKLEEQQTLAMLTHNT